MGEFLYYLKISDKWVIFLSKKESKISNYVAIKNWEVLFRSQMLHLNRQIFPQEKKGMRTDSGVEVRLNKDV